MNINLDWSAAIKPGEGMIGLTLGAPLSAVRDALVGNGDFVTFDNSPNLTIDSTRPGALIIRATDLLDHPHDWQSMLARLIFKDDKLATIIVDGLKGNDTYAYKGKFSESIGLGSRVSDLLALGPIDFDSAEEVFFSEQWRGMEVGGGSCDLTDDPFQVINFLKVYLLEPEQTV